MPTALAIPVGINLKSIGVEASWWLEAARQAEQAGFATAWIWDHFISRGKLTDPLLACWPMLTAAAVSTSRIHVGSFVANNLNIHPAVLANMVGTMAALAPGRVELGIGIGGHPSEHAAYGIDFPPPAERAARLEEAIALLRALFAGGPVDHDGRYYRLREAYAYPRPEPVPRIIVAGRHPAGARLAARAGDGWTTFADAYADLRPSFERELDRAGRPLAEMAVVVALESKEIDEPLAIVAERWAEAGATELVVHDVSPERLERILTLL
jgi:alkanesulfonate monooxygenase SsuD/methylene tetrahydromethanopterin reductase-like flavin-dependent oxidoreductase (luciferase family)